MSWLAVAVGGAAGSVLRYGVGVGLTRMLGSAWPYGTLVANILGSFLLMLVMEAAVDGTPRGESARLLLGVGMMGGFTTYSSFNLEAIRMVQQGQPTRAATYVATTLAVCLLAGWAGLIAGRAIHN